MQSYLIMHCRGVFPAVFVRREPPSRLYYRTFRSQTRRSPTAGRSNGPDYKARLRFPGAGVLFTTFEWRRVSSSAGSVAGRSATDVFGRFRARVWRNRPGSADPFGGERFARPCFWQSRKVRSPSAVDGAALACRSLRAVSSWGGGARKRAGPSSETGESLGLLRGVGRTGRIIQTARQWRAEIMRFFGRSRKRAWLYDGTTPTTRFCSRRPRPSRWAGRGGGVKYSANGRATKTRTTVGRNRPGFRDGQTSTPVRPCRRYRGVVVANTHANE